MFDPYHKWLGIPKDQRPPTFYQLLGVAPDERDTEVIEEAAVRQTTHIRAYQIGPHAAECTQILNELSQARQTLVNPAKRKAYDDRLARQSTRDTLPVATAITAEAPPVRNAFEDLSASAAPPTMRRPRGAPSPSIQKSSPGWLLPAIIGGGAAILLLIGVVAVTWLSRSPQPVVEGPKPPVIVPPRPPIEPPVEDPPVKPQPPEPPIIVKPVEVLPPVAGKAGEIQLVAEAKGRVSGNPELLISPDGKKILYLQGGQACVRLTDNWEHLALVSGAAYHDIIGQSRDGSRVLLRRNNEVVLWNWDRGQEEQVISGPKDGMIVAAVSADGKWVAGITAAGPAVEVLLWERATGQVKKRLGPYAGQGRAIAFSEDGSRLHTAVRDANGTDIELATHFLDADRTESFKIPQAVLAAFSPDAKTVAAGQGGQVQVYETSPPRRIYTHNRANFAVHKLRFTNDGRSLALGATTGAIAVLNAQTGQVLGQTAPANGVGLDALAVANGVAATTNNNAGLLRLWRFQAAEAPIVAQPKPPPLPPPLPPVAGKKGEIQLLAQTNVGGTVSGNFLQLAMSPDGKKVLYSQRGKLVARNADNWAAAIPYEVNHTQLLGQSPDGSSVALRRGDVVLWNWDRNQEERVFSGAPTFIQFVALSPDGKWLAGMTQNQPTEVILWDRSTGLVKKRLGPLPGYARAVGFSGDGARLHTIAVETMGGEADLGVYHIGADRTETHKIPNIINAEFAPDGTRLAINSRVNGEVHVYDLMPFKRSYVHGGDHQVFKSRFSHDGRYLALAAFVRSNGNRQALVVLNAATGGMIGQTGPAEDFRMVGVAVAPNGMAATIDNSAAILRLWHCPTDGAPIIANVPNKVPPQPPEAGPPDAPKGARKPVPAEAQRQAAEQLLRERYAKDLARTAQADHAAFAEKLFKAADEAKDSAADRYALLNEAVHQAVQGVKPGLAFKGVDELTREFDVDVAKVRLAAYTSLGKMVQSKASSKELLDAALAAAREAALADDFAAAQQLVGIAKNVAPKTVNVTFTALVQKHEAGLEAMAKEFKQFQEGQATLKGMPGDVGANLAVGKYLSLRRGEWDRALPHLARGGDDALAALAREDVKNPQDGKAQADLAEAWWTAADKESELIKPVLQHRALYWYRQALPQTTGLLQTKISERIKALEEVPAPFQSQERIVELRRLKAHGAAVTWLELSPDGKKVFSAGLDGLVRGWEVGSGRMSYSFNNGLPVYNFSFSGDGSHLAVCSDSRVRIYELQKTVGKPRREMTSVPGVFWHDPDILFRVQDTTFWTHDARTGSGQGTGTATASVTRTVASPDRKMAVMLGSPEVVLARVPQRSTGLTQVFRREEATAAAFSPDNRLLALADKEGLVRIYDVNTKQEIKSFKGHVGLVRALAFATAGRLLSGGDDKSIRLWDVTTGKELGRAVHSGAVNVVVAAADGRLAFSGSTDLTLRQWELPEGK